MPTCYRTYCQYSSVGLGGLAIVKVQVEKMLHLPVREEGTVRTEDDTVGVIDATYPDGQLWRLQHTANLPEHSSQ